MSKYIQKVEKCSLLISRSVKCVNRTTKVDNFVLPEPEIFSFITRFLLENRVFLHVPFRQQIWPPRAILVSDWLMLKKSSPLKLFGQMEPNLAGSIYVRLYKTSSFSSIRPTNMAGVTKNRTCGKITCFW